jgi:NAD(P)H-dependent FMN reductase
VPLYHGDVEKAGIPEQGVRDALQLNCLRVSVSAWTVQRLKGLIASADAIVFATPEYNFSFSGVLKNAIDWASRCVDIRSHTVHTRG